VIFAYAEVEQSAVAAARQRLQLISRQLADLVTPGVPRRVATLKERAAAPAVRALFLAPADSAARAAALASAANLRSVAESELPIAIWSTDGTVLAESGVFPKGAITSPSGRATDPTLLPESAGVSQFFGIGSQAYYWVAAPVERGGQRLGWLGELRQAGSAGVAQQIETLIGSGIEVYFANTAAGLWVSLDGTLSQSPPAWPFTAEQEYSRPSKGDYLGYATPLTGTPWAVVVEQPERAIMERPYTVLRRSVIASVLLAIAGAAGAWVISRGITRPLRELRLAANAVARGDYARRIQLRRGDELGVLAESFNWMAEQVQSTHDVLRQQFETAQSLADDLEHANRRLERAIADAEDASRTKDQFLATMSHEIRTPINAILGYTELLRLGVAGTLNEGQEAQLERLEISGRHLLDLVDQVLDFARTEAGTLPVEQQSASISDSAQTALTVVGPQAAARGVELGSACVPESGLTYLGDAPRVHQILVNLLGNAIKFTEPGGKVTLRCTSCDQEGRAEEKGQWVCLAVEDTGMGIPPERLADIFEPFVQVESGYTRRHGGAGLGLAISRRLAHAMGGELSAESEPGRGSRFTLRLRRG
jgi:signal transduction histidine kinase